MKWLGGDTECFIVSKFEIWRKKLEIDPRCLIEYFGL
jgi:hypothetical protein